MAKNIVPPPPAEEAATSGSKLMTRRDAMRLIGLMGGAAATGGVYNAMPDKARSDQYFLYYGKYSDGTDPKGMEGEWAVHVAANGAVRVCKENEIAHEEYQKYAENVVIAKVDGDVNLPINCKNVIISQSILGDVKEIITQSLGDMPTPLQNTPLDGQDSSAAQDDTSYVRGDATLEDRIVFQREKGKPLTLVVTPPKDVVSPLHVTCPNIAVVRKGELVHAWSSEVLDAAPESPDAAKNMAHNEKPIGQYETAIKPYPEVQAPYTAHLVFGGQSFKKIGAVLTELPKLLDDPEQWHAEKQENIKQKELQQAL